MFQQNPDVVQSGRHDFDDTIIPIDDQTMFTREDILGIHVLHRDLVQRDSILVRPIHRQPGHKSPDLLRQIVIRLGVVALDLVLQITLQPILQGHVFGDIVPVLGRVLLGPVQNIPGDLPEVVGLFLGHGNRAWLPEHDIAVSVDKLHQALLGNGIQRVVRINAMDPRGTKIVDEVGGAGGYLSGKLEVLGDQVPAGDDSSAKSVPGFEEGDTYVRVL